ncbi:MAG: ROK family protein, partial [Gammaproteobacteria bacterium]|nr:ROK family protein [Gammaproteobacteria bacterium]
MRFGIDLGGTKIELIALDDSGLEVFRERMTTPQGDYAATLEVMVQLVQQAEATLGVSGTLGI